MSFPCLNSDTVTQEPCVGFIDCAASQSSLRLFERNPDGSNGVQVSEIEACGEQYNLYVDWVDCKGSYVGDDVPPEGFMRVTNDVGQVSFDNNNGVTNKYIYTAPNSLTNDAILTFGMDGGEGLDLCSITLNIMECPNQTAQKSIDIPQQFIEEPNVTAAIWEQMTDTARVFDQNSDKITIQDIGAGYAINVRHEPSSVGSPRVQMGGSLPNQECYTVSQIINFRAPFDFGGASAGTQVGKAGFGLAGGGSSQAATLGNIVAGGDPSTSGYSIRPAWTSFNTVSGQPEFMFYSYHANRNPVSGTFGENIQTGHVIVPGQDISVVLEICMNDPGSSNGTIQAWIDGSQVVNRSDILWMTGTPEIDWCFFCSFHGGGGDSAPVSDQSVSYRDIAYT